MLVLFFFSSRRRHTRCLSDWSSDVCSSDLDTGSGAAAGDVGSGGTDTGVGGADGGAGAPDLGDGSGLPDAPAGSWTYLVYMLADNNLEPFALRSEERRVGKGGRIWWEPYA